MSSLKRNLFLSVFGAAMSATVVLAADLPAPPIIEYEPETPVEIGSSWYLRGDLGFTIYEGANASWKTDTGGIRHFTNQSIEDGWVGGIGAGYYFNEFFRADVTLDYRHGARHKGTAACPPYPCTTRESVDFSAWTLMANGYVDFASFYGVTPYIGGGVGVAWLNADNYKTTGTGTYVFRSNTETNFAWNATAGAVFNLADNIKVDANYRLVSLGKAKTGRETTNTATNPVRFKNLYAHDFRVGLRYDLN